jgi:hypothetical protein
MNDTDKNGEKMRRRGGDEGGGGGGGGVMNSLGQMFSKRIKPHVATPSTNNTSASRDRARTTETRVAHIAQVQRNRPALSSDGRREGLVQDPQEEACIHPKQNNSHTRTRIVHTAQVQHARGCRSAGLLCKPTADVKDSFDM